MMTDLTFGIVKVSEYFDVAFSDCTTITWAHGVNTRATLKEALEGDLMMIEADIMMGRKDGYTQRIPIMAHPPTIISDLSFDDFMEEFINTHKNKNLTKGIKLDFKQIEAVEICLKALKLLNQNDQLNFPVWINADILQGPVNSTKPPIDGDKFLHLIHKYLPTSTISLGWVTRYGRDDIKNDPFNPRLKTINGGEYSKENVDEMLYEINKLDFDWLSTLDITFPVRAGLAVNSEDNLLRLLNTIIDSTASITIWSAKDDPVDLIKLRQLISIIGRSRTYIDLPFDLRTGPIIIPDVKFNENTSSSSYKLFPTTLFQYFLVIIILFSYKIVQFY